ncbi:MAG: hypothetical protein WDN25_13110 [Acetobacteraceae bacterium]
MSAKAVVYTYMGTGGCVDIVDDAEDGRCTIVESMSGTPNRLRMRAAKKLRQMADQLEHDAKRKMPVRDYIETFKPEGAVAGGSSVANREQRADLTREHFLAAWAPEFTTSIDAAASLMPAGFAVTIEQRSTGWLCVAYTADDGQRVHAKAPTEPQARTAAALRAMAEVQS